MKYASIPTALLHSPEFIGSNPTQRGTWAAMILWCCQQENGGRIAGVEDWGDRRWQQTCGVTLAELKSAGPLVKFERGRLVVFGYPQETERFARARRNQCRTAASISAKARSTKRLAQTRDAVDGVQRDAKDDGERGAQTLRLPPALPCPAPSFQEPPPDVGGAGGDAKPLPPAALRTQSAKPHPADDAEWLRTLAGSPAYAHLSITVELAKCKAWCAANGKQPPSRRRFVNWLNRCPAPMDPDAARPTREILPEPPRWRDRLREHYPAAAVLQDTRDWAHLAPQQRQDVTDALRRIADAGPRS